MIIPGNDGQAQQTIDMSQTTSLKCEKCGNSTFKSTIILRRMSSIMSVDGQETIFPIAVFCCEKCGNPTFIQAVLLKRIPASISPNGKKTFLPMPIFECSSCGHVNDELIPTVKGSDSDVIQ